MKKYFYNSLKESASSLIFQFSNEKKKIIFTVLNQLLFILESSIMSKPSKETFSFVHSHFKHQTTASLFTFKRELTHCPIPVR